MKASEIQKYQKKSIPDLLKIATKHFNKWIRERDKGKGCISCDTGKVENAGHYFSAGQFPPLRFNEDNVNGQCIRCNKWNHGSLIQYGHGLQKKIGIDRVTKLNLIAMDYKRTGWKWERFYLIDVITRYRG